ncbi:MAG: beta-galactosidase [Clostridia bacterium]|nr:beta-galactosidase [Clostridia bacterium]
MKKKLSTDHLTLGVCYYPEHWDKSLWRDDLRRMRKYGIEVIRIAEFAWNKFEPRESSFTFDFFDEFMDMTVEEGMKVIFCTPSATPPMWLCEKYPEILNANIDGDPIYPGMRRHNNLNSEKYRFFAGRIAERLAEHYGKYENIVAWQIDNEINCEASMYYSESDHAAFRKWLKNRFGTLDNFNAHIGAEFWNQTYTDWEEVHLPRRTNAVHHSNPHIELLQKRFISDTVISFIKLQADAIRKHSSASVTTNGIFPHIDYHRLTDEVLDFITYDNYPNFAFEITRDPSRGNRLRDRNSSYNLATIRSISPVFGIMEQQSGPSGWSYCMVQSAPKPGQVRLWTLQAVAHGADFVSYFRWRTCTYGTEIYWHGINDYCNRPNRRTEELEKTYASLNKIQNVCGSEYMAEAAILRDYDNEWDGESDIWHAKPREISNNGWFCAFQKKHIPLDFLYINDDTDISELLKYKLLVYPHPAILTQKRAEILKEYAEQGGIVIFGCRTGYKGTDGICSMKPMPGYAAELCGAEVEDFTFLSQYDAEQYVELGGKRVSAPCFNDILSVTDGEAAGVFLNNYYACKPAASVKNIGNGRVYYFGAAFAEDTASAFIDLIGLKSPVDWDIPESVELAIRGKYAFLLNYNGDPVSVPCEKLHDELSGKDFNGTMEIGGYDAVVIKI